MINRFHNAVPAVPVSDTHSQSNKAKPGDGFALLLNELASPVAEQQKVEAVSDGAASANAISLLPLAPANSSKFSSVSGADVEMVTIPWRLQANAAMSYQLTAKSLKNIEHSKNALIMSIQTTAKNPANHHISQGFSKTTSVLEDPRTDKALQFYQMAEEASKLAGALENFRLSRSDSRASIVMWPQRVLHWLADGDATTAWVRDYQLDADGTKTLVEALRCFAEQQGFFLRRIMLNGNEVWRTNSHS